MSDQEPRPAPAVMDYRFRSGSLTLSDDDVVAILDAELAYYEAIGAIGPQLEAPPEP